ncbi:F-box protein At5g07610-like [Rosa rugosa]|uniref:F-box protein At5g07610-like n=1 Tax=Rosa rugosa TaxID=74645 RepID=UPI002B4056F2|nr:F-box protein At5g07610-like [Rosa rugosa]XP_061992133.1 F-box protein At5g07610-like [Rosa rugosa]
METACPESPKHSLPAETIADHDDLLSQILVRLEAKSLIRYKSVSKHWLSLISSPKFRERHTLRNPNPTVSAFFFLSTNQRLSFISLSDDETRCGSHSNPLDSVPELRGIKILQSCNGLLLCCSGGEETTRRAYYVVNPTASQFSRLPSPPYACQFDDSLGIALAFDPYRTGNVHYKVVSVWMTSRNTIGIGIYASETRSWSLGLSQVDFRQCQFEVDFGRGVYCNGAIHWLNHKDELFHCHIGDGSDEKPVRGGVLSSPLGLMFDREYRYFGESCGHLHLIDIFKPCVNQFDVRELEPDYSGWVVKYHVDLDPIIETNRPCINEMLMPKDYSGWFVKCKADLYSRSYSFQEVVGYYLDRYYQFVVLSLTREENGGDLCLLLYFRAKVISYNLRDKTFKKLCDLAPEGTAETQRSLQVEWLEAYNHMGSLACV